MNLFKRGKRRQDHDPVAWASDQPSNQASDQSSDQASDGPEDNTQLAAPTWRPGRDDDLAAGTEPEYSDAEPESEQEPAAGGQPVLDRSAGPWDVTEASTDEGYLDLGGLRLPLLDGMELRLEVEEQTDRVTAATVQIGGSAVQLQAFAAPRTQGIWDEIRTEIASSVTRQGGTADEVPGAFGKELLARIPVVTPDGRSGHQPARFAGVDGPRWFLRAVFHGAAAYEHDAAGELEAFVRDVVVVRGSQAMAPRELLGLHLPDQPPAPEEAEPEREPLQPFVRGPEITEVR